VLTGRERHTVAQEPPSTGGYPMRAIRNDDFLYIRNFRPERWPAGLPEVFRDVDGGPTKTYILDNRTDPKVAPFFDLAFAKRPAEELYDLSKDPHQLTNVAGDPAYNDVKARLSKQLMDALKATEDPRAIGGGEKFDEYPYKPGGNSRKKNKKAKK